MTTTDDMIPLSDLRPGDTVCGLHYLMPDPVPWQVQNIKCAGDVVTLLFGDARVFLERAYRVPRSSVRFAESSKPD